MACLLSHRAFRGDTGRHKGGHSRLRDGECVAGEGQQGFHGAGFYAEVQRREEKSANSSGDGGDSQGLC